MPITEMIVRSIDAEVASSPKLKRSVHRSSGIARLSRHECAMPCQWPTQGGFMRVTSACEEPAPTAGSWVLTSWLCEQLVIQAEGCDGGLIFARHPDGAAILHQSCQIVGAHRKPEHQFSEPVLGSFSASNLSMSERGIRCTNHGHLRKTTTSGSIRT